ncbi:hypothetical protein O0L34_g11101 [Tuta absoluta]|nr:hypothetical protein O0L34_g11101 [Tuta absoluta]
MDLIRKHLANKIEEIKGISERITVLNIKLPTNKNQEETWTIIQAYSPTESNKKEDIARTEKFYEDLHATIEDSYKNLIVMGDFNGQIGKREPGEEYAIGTHGSGERSKNGKRIVNFALEHKLSILNSYYKKKPSRKWTWISPNGNYKNEIDFIMSNNIKVFKDVSVLNHFNFNSDHRMVRATITGRHARKTRRSFKKENKPLMCLGKSDKLVNKLEAMLYENNTTMSTQEKYKNFINTLKNETIKLNREGREKISTHTQILLEERKELLKQGKATNNRQKISDISKRINESLRKDRKTRRQNTLKKHIEKTGGVKKAYKQLNQIKAWMPNIKNKQGKCTSKRKDIIETATEYYRNLYTSQKLDNKKKLETTNNFEPIPPILKGRDRESH